MEMTFKADGPLYWVKEEPRQLLSSFVLRTVGRKESEQAEKLLPKNPAPGDHAEMMLKLAVVAVNGSKVPAPYDGMDAWSDKAKALAMKMFIRMNGVNQAEEDEVFQGAVAVLEQPSADTASRSTGG